MLSWSVLLLLLLDCVISSSSKGISRQDPKCNLCGSGVVNENVAGMSLIRTE